MRCLRGCLIYVIEINQFHRNVQLFFVSVEGSKSFIQLPMTQETEIVIGSAETENGFDGCIKDLRLNGRVLPLEKSDDVAIVAKYKGRYL